MKEYKKRQLKRIRVYLIVNGEKRSKYLKKHKIFKEMGENVFFQPRKIPSDPKLIKLHDNITVGSGVTFVNHDGVDKILNNMNYNCFFHYYANCIEIMNDVFIGCNSIILPGIVIGPRAIIAAGSVVTKDVKENTVVAGVPAKVIGTFDEYVKTKRVNYDSNDEEMVWRRFNEEKFNRKK